MFHMCGCMLVCVDMCFIILIVYNSLLLRCYVCAKYVLTIENADARPPHLNVFSDVWLSSVHMLCVVSLLRLGCSFFVELSLLLCLYAWVAQFRLELFVLFV